MRILFDNPVNKKSKKLRVLSQLFALLAPEISGQKYSFFKWAIPKYSLFTNSLLKYQYEKAKKIRIYQ